jgi:isochorismate synthase
LSGTAVSVRATQLGRAFDLLGAYRTGGAAMVRDGQGVAGQGDALRWSIDQAPDGSPRYTTHVRDRLADFESPDVAIGPVAFGSIPFEPGLASRWIIPSRIVRRDPNGDPWLLEIGAVSGQEPFEPALALEDPPTPADELERAYIPSQDDYMTSVSRAVDLIRTGPLRKVVLARAMDVREGRPFDPRKLLIRLRAIEPSCYSFAFPLGPGRQLVGASPELLISRFGREIRANPLAGSAGRSGDPSEDRASAERLRTSAKDKEEHSIVVEAVARALRPFCEELRFDREPSLEETANVWHLSTWFRGTLRDPSVCVLDLVAALHPTPAVCGEPREDALAAIRDLEGVPRGAYAGPIGWMDARGDGVWALALRCAEISEARARLFAGAGIVVGSVPERELEETERKFRAFLDPLRWG